MPTHSIYILSDPRDGRPRYVGRTTNMPRRLREHIRNARGAQTKLDQWILRLESQGITPCIEFKTGAATLFWAIVQEKTITRHYAQTCDDLLNKQNLKPKRKRQSRPLPKGRKLWRPKKTTEVA